MEQRRTPPALPTVAIMLLVGVALVAASFISYPLFHTVVEVFTTVIAVSAFIIVWDSRRRLRRDYLLLLGIAFLFFAVLEIPHMLSYKGLGLFPGYGIDLPTQLYIAQRYMLALSFLAAPFFARRRLPIAATGAVYTLYVVAVLLSLFVWRAFPVALTAEGLTPFKVISEYVIVAILLASLIGLYSIRDLLPRRKTALIAAATLTLISSELLFTLYGSPFGVYSLMGHLAQVLTFALVYVAVVRAAIADPFSLLYRELAESEHRFRAIAETLQEALISFPRSIEGLEFGHAYQSATEAARVGGDFYDAFELEHARVGVLIGDVSGKGVRAAVLTSFVRDSVRIHSLEPFSTPASVVRTANEELLRESAEEVFVTLVFAVLDRSDGRLTYCNAGHPAAFVRHAAGGLARLPANSPLTGAFSGLTFEDSTVMLEPGDAVFLYTDGLIEARRGSELLGEDRLAEMVAAAEDTDLQQAVQDVVGEVVSFAGKRLADDAALLALRWTGPLAEVPAAEGRCLCEPSHASSAPEGGYQARERTDGSREER